MDPRLIDDLETVTFPIALRGYDREAVDAYIREVAARVERASAVRPVSPTIQKEFDRVGEPTAGHLADAERDFDEMSRRRQEIEAEIAELELRRDQIAAELRQISERKSPRNEVPRLAEPPPARFGGRFRPRESGDPAEL